MSENKKIIISIPEEYIVMDSCVIVRCIEYDPERHEYTVSYKPNECNSYCSETVPDEIITNLNKFIKSCKIYVLSNKHLNLLEYFKSKFFKKGE